MSEFTIRKVRQLQSGNQKDVTKQRARLSECTSIYIRICGLRLICFLFSREDQLPILTRLDSHLAKESLVAFELSPNHLPEKEYFRDQVSFVFYVFDMRNRSEFWWHDLKYNSKLISQSTTSFYYQFFHLLSFPPNVRPLLFSLFQMQILSQYILILLYFCSDIYQQLFFVGRFCFAELGVLLDETIVCLCKLLILSFQCVTSWTIVDCVLHLANHCFELLNLFLQSMNVQLIIAEYRLFILLTYTSPILILLLYEDPQRLLKLFVLLLELLDISGSRYTKIFVRLFIILFI